MVSQGNMASSDREYEFEAKDMVQKLLTSTLERVKKEKQEKTIKWPMVCQYSQQTVEEAIEKFVKTWKLDDSWKHCIDYIGKDGRLHCFKVMFSQPTRRRPAPRTTASVYFHISVQGEDTDAVGVYYIVEGYRVVLKPDRETFQEKWLKNAIASKASITGSSNIK